MLTYIIFTILVLLTFGLNLLIHLPQISFGYITLAMLFSIVGEIAIDAIVATIVCKLLPDKWFNYEHKFYNVSKKEYNFYVKFFKVKVWKDNVLDLGKLNGFKKDEISNDPEHLKRFLLECNKGYLEHLLSIILGALLLLAYPKTLILSMGIPAVLINFIINYMSIIILRFNIPRLKSALKYSERKKND